MTPRLRGDGRLVGRDEERARLLRLARILTRGSGGVGVVAGPAGVGKSRLVDDLAGRVDATVLRVRAAESLVELPFAGLVRALSSVRRSPAWPSLVDGLPRLHALWPGDVPVPVGTTDPELERAALVYAVAEVFRRLARRGPVLLVLDDVHWVDRASLDVLAQLGPTAEDHPLLVLATVRSDLAHPERPHDDRIESRPTSWSDSWPTVDRVELTRLSDALTATMLTALLGGEAPPELLDVVRDRAAGVPLFVRALVFALAEAGALCHDGRSWSLVRVPADTPATVRQLVLDRLALRGEPDRAVVRTVAVAGDAVPHDVLSDVVDLPPEELVDVLSRLTAAGLVIEEARDEVVYRVEHPLVRSALADSVGALARRRLHARLFDAFVDRHPRASHDQARHVVAAGAEVDPTRGLPVLLDVLRSTAALDDAIDLALAARRLALRGPAPTVALVEALELLGQAYESGDDRERAGATWDEALGYADDLAPGTVARLHRRRALLAWDRLEVELAHHHLRHALATGPDDPERAAALHVRLLFAGQGADPTPVADAVEELRGLRDDPDRDPVEALLGHCWAELNAGRFHTARLAAQGALSSEAARDDPEIARRAHLELTVVCWMLGDHAGLAAHAEQATAVDQRFGGAAQRAQTDFRVGIASVMAGDPARAVERLEPAVAAAEGAGFSRVGVACSGVLAAALALTGDHPGARRAAASGPRRRPRDRRLPGHAARRLGDRRPRRRRARRRRGRGDGRHRGRGAPGLAPLPPVRGVGRAARP